MPQPPSVPLDLGGDLKPEIANTSTIAAILSDRANPCRASAAAEFIQELLDRTLAAKVTGPVACAKGCHLCCHTYVSATIPEVLHLARAVRTAGIDEAPIHVAAREAQAIGQDGRFMNRVSCPLLDNGACSAYSARPLACRTMLSRSLAACERFFPVAGSGALDYAPRAQEARGRVELVLGAALSIAGLPGKHVELIQGLSIALSCEDAEGRWLAGEEVFAAVAADASEEGNSALATWVPILVAEATSLVNRTV